MCLYFLSGYKEREEEFCTAKLRPVRCAKCLKVDLKDWNRVVRVIPRSPVRKQSGSVLWQVFRATASFCVPHARCTVFHVISSSGSAEWADDPAWTLAQTLVLLYVSVGQEYVAQALVGDEARMVLQRRFAFCASFRSLLLVKIPFLVRCFACPLVPESTPCPTMSVSTSKSYQGRVRSHHRMCRACCASRRGSFPLCRLSSVQLFRKLIHPNCK